MPDDVPTGPPPRTPEPDRAPPTTGDRPDERSGTTAVWGGEDHRAPGAPTQIPTVQSVAFGYRAVADWERVARGEQPGHIYGRNTNPTVAAFEEKVRLLERAPWPSSATSFATGMAAISSTFWALLRPGARVVSIRDTYGGTSVLFTRDLPSWGVDVELCRTDDPDAIERAIARGCDLLYLETPTNPTLKVLDLARLSAAGRHAGAVVVVDNTFATPLNQSPLELGAHLVVHSATKFLGGHADALGGVVVGEPALVERIFRHREVHGASLHPEAAYLLLRGLKTLHLRVARQNETATRVARWLSARPQVSAVHYPGLESDPGYAVASTQMSGFGGVLSFELHGGAAAVTRCLEALRYAHLAANLGAVETVAGTPATTSHVECTPEEREALGIPEALVRYSVGIEDVEDLIVDLGSALDAAGRGHPGRGH